VLQGSPVGQSFDDAIHYNQYHRISHQDDKTYTFWNTPDLNEPFPVTSHDAVRNLQSVVDDFGIDLLIYCIQDGLVEMTRVNYDLVWRDICQKKTIVLVATGLKGKPDEDEWWRENETIKEIKMAFDRHVCIPSWKNWNDNKSAEKLWSLVRAHFGPKHNIVLFGEAGAGKSSIVNMIVGKALAKVSGAPSGCTFRNDVYEAIIGDKRYVIYDIGLNVFRIGRRFENSTRLFDKLDGISLLICCMRGRVLGNAKTKE